MEFIDKLLTAIPGLLEAFFMDRNLVLASLGFIGLLIVFKIGFILGNKKKPPEFKVKMKDSYSLEELSDISLKK